MKSSLNFRTNYDNRGATMMKKILQVIFLLCFVCIFLSCSSDRDDLSSQQYAVVIDASHGGQDPGAVLESKNLTEKEIVLEFCRKLKSAFEKNNMHALLLRDQDRFVSFQEKMKKIDQSAADMIISIHTNMASDPARKGYDTFHQESSEASLLLDSLVHEELDKANILKDNGSRHGPFYILQNTSAPAILINLGYLSNAEDLKKITDENVQQSLAEAIVKAAGKFRAM